MSRTPNAIAAFDAARWAELSPLLDEALDMDDAGRTASLDRLEAADPRLAADLRGLLADHAASERAGFLAGAARRADPALAGDGLAGKVLGAYTLEKMVGQGGMGSVWRAHRSDGRFTGSVAIKLLNVSLIGGAAGARFQREGRILARLTHPNIARLIDAGVTPGEQPYLALEYVEGEPIDRYCDERRLDCEARIGLFLAVLAAVEHSHAHLIVHRDLKPMNVLVDGEGHVKLLDFGIAKLLEDDESAAGGNLTRADSRLLTPDYASPEQVSGGPITTATDIYSLGVLLYELLSGCHPVVGPRTSAAELIRAVAEVDPAPMSTTLAGEAANDAARAVARSTSPERLRRTLEGDLDNIVAKAMRKLPQERYATVKSFSDDLHRFIERRPVTARPATLGYRLMKFASRNRGAVVAGALSACAVVAGVAGTLWQAHRASEQAGRAERFAVEAGTDRDRALKQLSYAEAYDEFLAFLLQEAGDKPLSVSELLGRGEAAIERQFADDPALRTHMLLRLVNLYGESMDQRRASALLRSAQAAASGVDDPALLAELDCAAAERVGDENAFARSMALFARGIARVQGSGADRAILADCLAARSEVEKLQGDQRAAMADAKAALAAFGTPRPGQRASVLNARYALADVQGNLGDEYGSIAALESIVEETTRLGRGQNLSQATMLATLGLHLSRAGQWQRAADVYQRALTIVGTIEGAGNAPPTLSANYGKLLVELGDPRQAQGFDEAALKAAAALGHVRSRGPISLTAAWAWCAVGDLARCRSLLATARIDIDAMLPPGHSMRGSLDLEEGRLAVAADDAAAAKAHFEHALALFAKATDRNPNRLRAASWLARAEARGGDLARARTQAEQAVAASRAALGGFARSFYLGEALLVLGEVASAQGDAAAARSALDEAALDLDDTVGAAAPAAQAALRLRASLR